jgi:HK97 family phage portal protein
MLGFMRRFVGQQVVEPPMIRALDQAEIRTRAIDSFQSYPGLTEQLLAAQGLTDRDYRLPSIREALGIPAVWRAVSLLANLAGALPMVAYRNGEPITDDPPRIVTRPNPFSTPRAFVRNLVYSLATRGEAFAWVSSRDADNRAEALIPLNPAEVLVKWAPGLEGIAADYLWRDRKMPREDIVHLTLMRDFASPRGMGPLQVAGAAVSVGVEATAWAAQFFGGGGIASVVLKWAADLDPAEAQALKDDWTNTPSNQPKVASGGLEPEAFGVDPESATYAAIRDGSVGEVARLFGIPAHLLAYGVAGSNLTYQNLGEVSAELVRFTLWPMYLEPIEQAISDLLPRTTVARFDLSELLRPDHKTRAEIHQVMIDAGVYDADHARVVEGLDPGSPAYAPTPAPIPTADAIDGTVPA